MSSIGRTVSVECRWNTESCTFDLDRSSELTQVYKEIKECFTQLPQPFTKDGPSYRLTYLDDDGEEIELETSSDLSDAMSQASNRRPNILQIFVRPPTHMTRSGMIEGEWENVKTQQEAESPTITPVAAPTTEPWTIAVDAPTTTVVSATEEKAAPEPTPFDQPTNTTTSTTTAATTTTAPSAAAAVPTSSPSSGWSIFNVFGRSSATAPAAPEVVNAPVSQPLSQDSSSTPSLANSAVGRASEREFYEMPLDDDATGTDSNTFTRAMDAQFASGVAKRNLWDSTELTSNVLSDVFNSMIRRTEERLGLPHTSTSQVSGSLVRQPQQAMLAALEGLDAADFGPLVDQFAMICLQHTLRREQARKEEEERRLAEAVAELEAKRQAEEAARIAAEQARVESERLAAAALAAAEEERQRKLAAVQEKEALAKARREALRQEQELEQAELERMAMRMAALKAEQERVAAEAAQAEQEARELELEAAVPVQARLAPVEPSVGLASPPEPVDNARLNPIQNPAPVIIDNSQIPRGMNDSPGIVVPMVPIPVASPIAPSAQNAASRFNAAMIDLRAMGFTDDALNTFVLQKTNCDMGQTLDWLSTDAATGGALKNELQALIR